MKSSPSIRPALLTLPILISGVVFFLPASIATAQESEPFSQEESDPFNDATLPSETQENSGDERATTFEIFLEEGLSVEDYIDTIKANAREFYPREELNFIITPDAAAFRLPEIDVITNFEGALGVLEACSTRDAEIEIDTDSTGSVRIIRLNQLSPSPTVGVINVQSILKDASHEDFISAIGIGLEMTGGQRGVSMKLHEETGLFFVKGPERDIEVIHQIVAEMQKNTRIRNAGGLGGGSGGNQDLRDGGDGLGDNDGK